MYKCTGVLALPVTLCGAARHCLVYRCKTKSTHTFLNFVYCEYECYSTCLYLTVCLFSDAAHRVHPLAGLGVNLGFGDVSCLHRVLLTAASRGEDWGKWITPPQPHSPPSAGSLSSLKEYESSRQRHNVPVMATIDGLQRLFSTSWTPAVLLRSVGLQLFGALSPVKV